MGIYSKPLLSHFKKKKKRKEHKQNLDYRNNEDLLISLFFSAG